MDKKVVNNAISAYLWLSFLLLLPSKNANIGNSFVKNHAKTALVIHILCVINYLIFITYWLGGWISFQGFFLNHVLGALWFFVLIGFLFYGVFQAYQEKSFWFGNTASTPMDALVQVKKISLNEEGIFSCIVSLVPFCGIILSGQFSNNKSALIENNVKLWFFVSILLALLYTSWYENITFLLGLFYVIFVAFYSLLLIINEQVLSFSLQKIPTLTHFYLQVISSFYYIKNFLKKNFTPFQEILAHTQQNFDKNFLTRSEFLKIFPTPKLPKIIAYIPYLNLISLYDINSTHRYHIINGLLLTGISTIFFLISSSFWQVLVIFYAFLGIGYRDLPGYVFPFVFDIYVFLRHIFEKIFSSWKKISHLHQTSEVIEFEITSRKEQTQSVKGSWDVSDNIHI